MIYMIFFYNCLVITLLFILSGCVADKRPCSNEGDIRQSYVPIFNNIFHQERIYNLVHLQDMLGDPYQVIEPNTTHPKSHKQFKQVTWKKDGVFLIVDFDSNGNSVDSYLGEDTVPVKDR